MECIIWSVLYGVYYIESMENRIVDAILLVPVYCQVCPFN